MLEIKQAFNLNIPVIRRAEMLAELMDLGKASPLQEPMVKQQQQVCWQQLWLRMEGIPLYNWG